MLTRTIGLATIAYWLTRQWQRSAWFKPVVIGVGMSVVVIATHQEFIDYAEISSNTENVLYSFVLKWASLLVIAMTVIGWTVRRIKAGARRIATQSTANESTSDNHPAGVDFDNPRSAGERILDE